MNANIKFSVIAVVLLLLLFADFVFAETRLCGYEPSDESVTVTTVDASAAVSIVMGGTGGIPYPTDGDYLLKVDCGNEPDAQVEVMYDWDTFTFSLNGNDRILVDIYIPSEILPSLIGVWDDVFGYYPTISTAQADQWMTYEFDVSANTMSGLDHIWSVFFNGLAQPNGTIYMDNLRLSSFAPNLKTVIGQEKAIEVYWENKLDKETIDNLNGYNVYRRPAGGSTWTQIANLHDTFVYVDFVGANGLSYDYKVTSVVNSVESPDSNILSATSVAQTDAEFIETLQRATFRMFWDWGHPVSGMVREYHPSWGENRCDLLATGYGFGAFMAGAENGWITRAQAARRTLKLLRFMDSEADRYHGVWSHLHDGASGDTIPFSTYDDGADLVLTALVVQNIIAAREYYTGVDAVEAEIRTLADNLWRDVEWDWFRRMPETNGDTLYWHWSPNYGWQLNMALEGWMEAWETYILAIASPTHPIPVSCYHDGWMGANESWLYYNGLEYYGHRIWAGDYGVLFTQQMPFSHIDPRVRDNVCNYFDNATNWTLYHRDYCIDNPHGHTDYGANEWGLSADLDPWGYQGHEPGLTSPYGADDNGTISTTAALASMPYTPVESTVAIRHMYDKYGANIYGAFGFKDSYNRNENWFANNFNAVNIGTNFVMIENYRSGLFWNLTMQDADIQQALGDIGFAQNADAGMKVEYYEGTWSTIPDFDSLTPLRTEVASVPMAYIRNREDNYGLRFSGEIDIATAGTYTFYTNSDDGSKLYVNTQLVVNNDGLHGPIEQSGSIALGVGKAELVVDYIEGTGGNLLEVSYSGPGITKQIIPVTVLTQPAPDTDPPTPNPASFATAPTAVSDTEITMTAAAGTDASGPVEYYFEETSGNPGGTDSGWQTSTSYTDTGLDPDTQYIYTVRMRDSVTPTPNVGTASSPASATTNPAASGGTDYANADIDVQGSVSGSYADTQASDNVYEAITEVRQGNPAKGFSSLEHKWTISVTGGDAVTFYIEAYQSTSSDGDNFAFAYSTDDSTYTNMLTVSKASDDNTAQSYVLPASTSGTVYVSVVDTDSTAGNQNMNTIYIDQMYIVSTGGTADTDPPTPNPATWAFAPSADSSSAISMTATMGSDSTGPVEYYFDETSGNPGGSDSGWQTSPSYTDTGLSASTQYTYTVQMRDSAAIPNVGTASAPVNATTNPGCTATDMHIEAVVCSEVACGGPNRNGIATVTIYDDCGNPVVNALVDGTFSGAFNETINDVATDSNGQAVLTTSGCVKRPSFTFTVDDVVHGTLPYDSDDDLATGCSG